MNPNTLKQLIRMLPPAELENGNVRTGPVRLGFASVFEKAEGRDGKEGKYTATLLFPPGSDMDVIEAAAEAKAAEEFGTAWRKKGCRLPFRAGDEPKFEDRPGYGPGVVWFRASSNLQPEVIDRRNMPVTDQKAVYPGVWALVTLRPFDYTNESGPGVSFGLQNVMILADDDRLAGGGTPAAEEFGKIDSLDDVDALLAKEEIAGADDLDDMMA